MGSANVNGFEDSRRALVAERVLELLSGIMVPLRNDCCAQSDRLLCHTLYRVSEDQRDVVDVVGILVTLLLAATLPTNQTLLQHVGDGIGDGNRQSRG